MNPCNLIINIISIIIINNNKIIIIVLIIIITIYDIIINLLQPVLWNIMKFLNFLAYISVGLWL